MATDRWQAVRGRRVYSRAGRSPAARRRGEKLLVAARRIDRGEIGAGDAAVSEVVTPHWLRRSVFREDGAQNVMGWFMWTVTYVGFLSLVVGVGMVAGWIFYGLWWLLAPKTNGLKFIPAAALTALLALVLSATFLLGSHDSVGAFVFAVWWRLQVVFAFGWLAFLIYAWGWPAVASVRSVKPSGSYRIAVDKDVDDEVCETTETAPQEEESMSKAKVVVALDDDDDEEETE